MAVSLVDHMGSDVSVANAARVSFAKESQLDNGILRQADAKLIAFLARENHWSPFAHAFVSLRIKAPIFILRQLGKHQVGLSWNEVSRRYVDFEPEFYLPDAWRGRAENVKQGSSEEPVLAAVGLYKEYAAPYAMHLDVPVSENGDRLHYGSIPTETAAFCAWSLHLYEQLLETGVCPEQARMLLPQNMMSEFIWSGSLMAFARVCNLRLDPHAQKECRDVAKLIEEAVEPLFPVSWKALVVPK